MDTAFTGNVGVGYPTRSRAQSADTGRSKGRQSRPIGFNTGLNLFGSSASIDLGLDSDLYSGKGKQTRSRSVDGTPKKTATKRKQTNGTGLGFNIALNTPILNFNTGARLGTGTPKRNRKVVEEDDEDDEDEEEDEEEDETPPPPPRKKKQVAHPTHTPTAKSKIKADGPSIQPIEDDDGEDETAVVPSRKATTLKTSAKPLKAIAAPPAKATKSVKLVPVNRRLTASRK